MDPAELEAGLRTLVEKAPPEVLAAWLFGSAAREDLPAFATHLRRAMAPPSG